MGLKDIIRNKRVYFDANILIYLLEGTREFQGPISEIEDLMKTEEIHIVSGDLIYTEMLPIHARRQDEAAMKHIIKFLDRLEVMSISKQITIQAGILRGELGMKTPDALHVVSAMNGKCDIFLTNDAGIRVPEGMQRILISDYA